MQPISGKPVGSTVASKCIETRSTCVVWDGPDINCLGVNLCKGQSIDIIIYNTAKKLCEVLDALKIDMVDLSCLIQGDTTGTPTNMQELFNLVISKLCMLQEDVTALENEGTTDIMVTLPPCLEYTIPDPANPGNVITISSLSLIDPVTSTSPIVQYLCTKICQLFSDLSALDVRVDQLELTVQTLMDTVATGVPSAEVPPCIGDSPMVLVDPQFPDQGAVPVIASLLCDLLEDTGTISQTNGDCSDSPLALQAPLGNYAPASPATMEDLGFVNNPTQLWEKINNLWVTVCDIRNFCKTVKATCCPTMCEDVTFQMGIVPTTTSRTELKLFLNGTYLDPISNQNQTGTFSFAGTFPVCSAPNGTNCWDVFQPATVTITDSNLPPHTQIVTLNGNQMHDLYTGVVTTINLDPPWDYTSNYTVTFSGTVIAPDYSVCNLNETKTLVAVCNNYAITPPINISNITNNGFTVSFTDVNQTPPTVLNGYTFIIRDVNGVHSDITLTAPQGYGSSGYYFYPSTDDIPGNPCSTGCDNFIITSQILEDTTYQVLVVANYNCGDSAQIGSSNFTTFVGVEITINPFTDASCVNLSLVGNLLVTPDTGTPSGDYSPNFNTSFNIDPINGNIIKLYGKPGVKFGYQLTTSAIKSADYSNNNTNNGNCSALTGVKCWGPPSLRKWNTGTGGYPQDGWVLPYSIASNTQGTHCAPGITSGYATCSYVDAGCYDYLGYEIVPAVPLINNFPAPSFIVDNAWNQSPSTQDEPGIYQNTYTSPDDQQFIIPPNTNTTLVINQKLHLLNSGGAAKITIKLSDPDNVLANQQSVWIPRSGANNNIRVIYPNPIKTLPGFNTVIANSPTPYYTTVNSPYNAGNIQGVPVFMRIDIAKWNGSSYTWPSVPGTSAVTCSNQVIYVTSDWILLQNIKTTGFVLPAGLNIGIRDKIRISFSAGAFNNGNNGDYPNSTPGTYNASTDFYSKVTITQDPFTNTLNNPGPYTVFKGFPSDIHPNPVTVDTNLTAQIASNLGTQLSSDFPGVTSLDHDYGFEFIITDDLTIEWEITAV